ncbi:MAG: PSD1 and planctomycete cytochrome C domain-containing protein [Pirellulales bacterium]
MRDLRFWVLMILAAASTARADEPPAAAPAAAAHDLARDILPLLKNRCVKCHGPAKQEGGLNLSTPGAIARGGENGAVIERGQADTSLLWHRVESDEMPPEDPLPAAEKEQLRAWITAGASGLPDAAATPAASDHWAFQRLVAPPVPAVRDATAARTAIDRLVLARLEAAGLAFNPEAPRSTLIRRVAFDLTGLPPTPDEVQAFYDDTAADAYERMVDRYLASPHYGERWGKHWLDAAGYADSNGYFSADSDRPLAYRYRDYVVRALNEDKPFDRFVLEQMAGDELSGYVPGQNATPAMISLLEATHYLRNGQDGTGESDGNPEEVRIDRYSALEATTQIVSSSLLGLTLQCAKCHDHKFEPISQRDYYRLQSVFYPALNIDDWQKPNDRHVFANLPGEVERYEARVQEIDRQVAAQRAQFADWVRGHRPPSTVLFHDEFADGGPALAENWSPTAPGDDAPGGTPAVALDTAAAPAAQRTEGALAILESGAAGDRWLSTRQAFDWTPNAPGEWIQVTFDLVADRATADGAAAARIAYFIALADFDDNGPQAGGNLLIDGNPAGGASVHLDYPGSDTKAAGDLGGGRYEPGHNFGVRITHVDGDKFRLEHLVDGVPEEQEIELTAADLPDGGFGFEYCCGRSFVVDNVLVERSAEGATADQSSKDLHAELRAKRKELADAVKKLEQERGDRPGKIACVFERSAQPPDVFLLERGNYGARGERVEPAPLEALAEAGEALDVRPPAGAANSSGRRLAWARWVTAPGSRAAALVARVQVNRLWQHYFGSGIVATTENLGTSGAPPSHPELLEYLAQRFVTSGWSSKALHREVLRSAVYRQTSTFREEAFAADPENRLLWRFSLRRLDGEALRDAMLRVAGALDAHSGGPYVPTARDEQGEVVITGSGSGAARRAIYLQQRRTAVLSFLNVFDSPSIVFNCVARPVSTMPLQSLSLLNSEFAVQQATRFAERVAAASPADDEAVVRRAYQLALAREPSEPELAAAREFVAGQRSHYAAAAGGADEAAADKAESPAATQQAWRDFCQMLLASNAFLYLE